MIGAGIYEMLPLGLRVLERIKTIIREEIDAAGGQEVLMPALLPAGYFQETGRWKAYGDVLFRIEDRKGGDYHLGPTHEEIITDMVRREVKSYRQLPLNLYQIQMKYRDEPRPRAGLMRCREFLMKDAYSFDADLDGAKKSYETMRDAYHRIFQRLGLAYRIVEADSGSIGGDTSAEFQVLAQSGEDSIVACGACDYAANVEIAETTLPEAEVADGSNTPEREVVDTPGVKTITQVVEFFASEGVGIERTIKSLVFALAKEGEEPELILACVRGDHEVNPIKLARALDADPEDLRMASDSEVGRALKSKPGYVGPVGFEGRRVVDPAVAALGDAVAGASETGKHLRHVAYGRDFEGKVAAIRQVGAGDPCPRCGEELASYRGIEGGHIFILGTHYSGKMSATFLDEQGESRSLVMGCYGIGVTRLMAAAIEQHHDDDGIQWPIPIAPYQAIVLPLGQDDEVSAAAETLYEELRGAGIPVLLDDRPERPGVKFKEADLIGVPIRLTIGSRTLKEGKAEIKLRTEKESTLVDLTDAAAEVRRLIEAAR